MGTKMAAKWAR